MDPVSAALASLAAFVARLRRQKTSPEVPVAPANELVVAMREAGLTVEEDHGAWRARGTLDGVRVAVSLHPSVIVEARLGIPSGVRVTQRELTDDRVLTGDSAFDDNVQVQGPPSWAFAILDPGTRSTLRERMNRRGLRVENGVVVWSPLAPPDGATLAKAVREIVDVAKLLSIDPARVDEMLAANLRAETNEAVRVCIVDQLAKCPRTPIVEAALEGALENLSARVRLAAARASPGERAREALAALARDRGVDESVRILALQSFAGRSQKTETAVLAGEVLHRDTLPLSLAALLASGDASIPQPALLGMADVLAAQIRLEVAKRLDASTPEGEKALLARLADDELGTWIVVAALETLGRTARISAIESLQPLTEGLPFVNAERRAAAAAAIEAIQERAKGDAGALTLSESDDERGRVSVAAAAGAVAIADRKKS